MIYRGDRERALLTRDERIVYYQERMEELEQLQPFYDHLIQVHQAIEKYKQKG